MNYLTTLKSCAEASEDLLKPKVEEESKLWVYIVGGMIVAGLSAGVTAMAFSL